MTRLGVFGGTFNPPHTAHLTVARRAMRQARLDEILWIPAGNPPHKTDEPVTDARHRVEMVRRLIEDEPAFHLSDLELRRSGPSYTVDTLEELARRGPDTHLFLIIGEDSLRRLHTWYNPERIVQIVDDILVVRRPNDADEFPVSEMVADRYTLLDGDPIDVSSSEIRRFLSGRSESTGGSAGPAPDADPLGVLPRRVLTYIREHNLYTSDMPGPAAP